MDINEQVTSLLKAPTSGLHMPKIVMENVTGGKVGGFVVSSTFSDMPQLSRQNMVWNYLETHLPKSRLMKIVSLITVTPTEFKVNH